MFCHNVIKIDQNNISIWLIKASRKRFLFIGIIKQMRKKTVTKRMIHILLTLSLFISVAAIPTFWWLCIRITRQNDANIYREHSHLYWVRYLWFLCWYYFGYKVHYERVMRCNFIYDCVLLQNCKVQIYLRHFRRCKYN